MTRSSDTTKSIYREMGLPQRLVSGVLHGIVLGAMRRVTAHQLKAIILGKQHLDFFVQGIGLRNEFKDRLIDIGRNNADQLNNWIKYEEMMDQLKEHRPDLFLVVDTFRGRPWFKEQIDRFQNLLSVKLKGCSQCKGEIFWVRQTGLFKCGSCGFILDRSDLFPQG